MWNLKKHPFAVSAFFDYSLVLTYAVPKTLLMPLIPPHLALDTWQDEWAFVAVALVQTKNLRPTGFPNWLGNDFFLVGYRIFVQYETNAGKRLRGLYILKSETDKYKMSLLGNIFTHYNYETIDIKVKKEAHHIQIFSQKSGLDISINYNKENVALPPNSPFADWKTARRFAGPLPFTFDFDVKKQEMLIVEGMRQNWIPKPVEVIKNEVSFVQKFENPVLANAFIIENISYNWKPGIVEKK
jgi:hypothetical protein